MTPCRAAVALVLFPLAFGVLIGTALANTWLTALEDARRQRREDVTRATAMEARLFVWGAANMGGPVIERDGGQTARNEN